MAFIAVILIAVTVAVTRITEANLLEQVDAQLAEAVAPIRGAHGDTGPGGPDERGNQDPPPSTGPNPGAFSSLYVGRVVDGDVETVLSPNLRAQAGPVPEVSAQQATASAASREPFTVDGGETRYRMLGYHDERSDSVVVIGTPIDSIDDSIANLVVVEAIGVSVILVALALLAWWVIRLGVRPIQSMTTTAVAIADGDLSQRVPDAEPGTEAGELGEALNTMLSRIEMSFAERQRLEHQLRQFVADASHELRTPVATIRGYAELYRSGGLAEPSALDDAMARTEAEAIRMGSLVEDLLQLARLDQGRPLSIESVDLGKVASDCVADAAAVDPHRPITTVIEEGVIVEGDDARLHQVVANLVGNALAHTPPDTPAEVSVSRDGDTASIQVSDEGPGMDVNTAAHAFERFYRGDSSRSRNHGGTGLGLSIVGAIVAAHGGTVDLRTAAGEGTTVSVTLPVAGPGDALAARSTPYPSSSAASLPAPSLPRDSQETPSDPTAD